VLLFACACVFVSSGSTATASSADWEACAGGYPYSVDQEIAGCTKVINSGTEPRDSLAVAYYNRGLSYRKKGQADRAVQDHGRAIELKPDYVDAYIGRANAYSDLAENERAIRDYDQAIKLQPGHGLAYYNRGLCYRIIKQYDLAIRDFNEALRLRHNEAEVYNDRGNAYGDKGEYDRAIEDYDQAIRLKPGFAAAYNNRGNAYGDKGQYDRAIQNYNQSLRLRPGDASTLYNRGNAFYKKGQYFQAIQSYDEAIRSNPTLAVAWGNRGLSYLKMGTERDVDRAIADSEQALRLDPRLNYVRVNLQEARDARAALIERAKAVGSGLRVALVIGNSRYDNTGPLPNAVNDARDVAKELSKLGYKVFGYPTANLRKRELEAQVDAFRRASVGAAAAVVWYSGHGLVAAEEASDIPTEWIVPVDAKIGSRKDIANGAIRLGSLTNAVLAAKTLRLVVMDACRDTRFYTGARGFNPRRDSNPGVVVIYSAQPGQIAQDGPENGNSPFAQAFLESVRKQPKRDVRLLFSEVSGRTQQLTGVEQQRPQVVSDVASGEVLELAP
jgi:tetratricopeptide (TPR) repeat protein